MSKNEISTKRKLKSSSTRRDKKIKLKKTKKIKSQDEYDDTNNDFKELNLSIKHKNDLKECLSHLELFFKKLNVTDLNNIITEKSLEKFEKISDIENIQVDLFLTKLYNKIIGSENFYTTYFADHDDNDEKINLTLILIDGAIKIIQNLEDYVISLDNFELKGNIMKLIKFMRINLKDDLDNEDKKLLDSYINDLPNQFYSSNYLEIIKYKNQICKNNYELLKNIEQIDDLFSSLESYYEQLSALELLFTDVETDSKDNSDKKNYISVSNKDIKKRNKKKKSKIKDDSDSEETDISNTKEQPEKITEKEIIAYGEFLVNICIHPKFHLITKQIKKPNKKPKKTKPLKSNKKPKPKPKSKKRKESVEEEEEKEEEDEQEEKEEEIEENNTKTKIKIEEEEEDEEEDEESEDDPEGSLNLFVIDAVKNVNGRIQKKSNENIELNELLEDKLCISLMEKNNLYEIIKKNISNFKNLTEKSKNKDIKNLNQKFDIYINSLKKDKYISINKDNINSIKYYNNFANNIIVIPNRDSKVFYIENTEDQKGLLLIEFELLDQTKDIIFTLNRYDPETDNFNQIYTSEKTNKKCKLCVYFEEKSLYQLDFNNEYSWFNSKQINFNISLFKILDKENIDNIKNDNNENNIINEINTNIEKKEEKNIEQNKIKISPAILKNTKEIKFYCYNDNINFTFNCNKIYKKIKDYQTLEKNNLLNNKNKISILIHLNKIRFITIDENNKIAFSEIKDEKEKIISKEFFNKSLSNYLNENYKPENDKENKNKVTINLYSLNKNLSKKSPKIKELISALEDYTINNVDQVENQVYVQFLQKLGFYPDKNISNYIIKYNLYDFTDQCLIYHLFLLHIQEISVESSTLVMIFDRDCVHITAMNEGAIYTKFKSLEKNWSEKYYSKIKMDDYESICNFISNLSDTFDGLDLVLCYINNEEKKEDLGNMFKLIKEFVEENIDEPINVYIYNEENFVSHILKYICMFLED